MLLVTLLCAFHLWLVAGQRVIVLASSGDDYLFIRLAGHLARMEWLGPYDHFTLVKGMFYPLWIAVAFRMGIPLLVSQHLLYVGSSLVLLMALRPARLPRWSLLLLAAALLTNPYTLSFQLVMRDGIYDSLALLVLACAIGLHLRKDGPPRLMAAWAAGMGTAFAAFWLTREEGVWLAGSLALLTGAGLVFHVLRRRAGLARPVLLLAPYAIWAVVLLCVSTANYRTYGVFGTVEFKAGPLLHAYGNLLRIKPAAFQPFVPVTAEVRQKVYEVSPSFAGLRPYFEGRPGRRWARMSTVLTRQPAANMEICGAYFIWAFRDAVAKAGHCKTGRSAMRFYEKMAREIDDACAKGLLDCGPRHRSLAPPLRREYAPLFLASLRRCYTSMVRMQCIVDWRSTGDDATRRAFERLTRTPAVHPSGQTPSDPALGGQAALHPVEQATIRRLTAGYAAVLPWLFPLCGCLFMAGCFTRQRNAPLFAAAAALLLAVASRLLILAIIDMSSFPGNGYVGPTYPLLIAFCALTLCSGVEFITARRAAGRPAASGQDRTIAAATPAAAVAE